MGEQKRPPFRLLFVGSRAVSGEEKFFPTLEAALEGGVDSFLLREKDLGGRELLRLTREARARTKRAGALLLVSDRIDVALAAGADGVHLPENSFSPSEARQLVGPQPLVGRSVHSLQAALDAEADGADYIVAGPLFETPGKPNALGIEAMTEIRDALKIPAIPVGGIDEENVALVARAGFPSVALIRGIATSAGPARSARTILSRMRRAK